MTETPGGGNPCRVLLLVDDETGELLEAVSDEQEIEAIEAERALGGNDDALARVLELRTARQRDEEEFGDYVEDVLVRPGLQDEIRDHALRWFRAKLRIERYAKTEVDAMRVIAGFALQIWGADPSRDDLVLAGPSAQVRVTIRKVVRKRARVA